jgi:hypothetical protein
MPLLSRSRGAELDTWPTDNVLPFRAHRRPIHVHVAQRRDDDAPSSGAAAPRASLLREEALRAIESEFRDGLTAVQIVDAFTREGIKFSEASFRKYVQQGLLPRSRRIGRKGKHKGSLGVYPAKTVRRINYVKQLMLDGFTIEEIQGQILLYTDLIEGVAENFTELWQRLQRDSARLDDQVMRTLQKEIGEARREGEKLVDKLRDIARRTAAPRTDSLRLAGAAGGAEDLL